MEESSPNILMYRCVTGVLVALLFIAWSCRGYDYDALTLCPETNRDAEASLLCKEPFPFQAV